MDDVPPELRGEADAVPEMPLFEMVDGLAPPGMSLRSFREAVEREFIRQRLHQCGWNVSRAAESLGIERTHLHKKMRVLGIQRGTG